MAHKRKLRDGTIGVANTIYLKESSDHKAAVRAKHLSKHGGKVSKSKLLVDAIEKDFPP